MCDASGGRSSGRRRRGASRAPRRGRGDRRAEDRPRRHTAAAPPDAALHRAPLAPPDVRPLHDVSDDPGGLQLVRLVEAPLQAEPRDVGQLLEPLARQRHPARALGDAPDHDRRHDPADPDRVARRLRVLVARLPGARLAVHPRDRASRGAAPDGADPRLQDLQHARAVRHDPRPRALPHGLRAPLRDLPAAELLPRDPEGRVRVGADRRRLGGAHLPPTRAPARPPRYRVARDLPVPLGVERPARRPDLRPRDAADHRRHLQQRPSVRQQHRAHRARLVRLPRHPARRLPRVPAVLHAGAAGGLGQVAGMADVAIVGGGLAGFIAYQTLRRGGLEPGAIAVFDPDPDPVATWRPRAEAIRQARMRSESDGHCYPASFPGLAPREAMRRGNLTPLAQTVCNRYRPTVREFLRHVDELRERSRWDESVLPSRVATVSPGHPGLSLPSELGDDTRVVHAYEPHAYASRVAIVGAGMAAATEWLNALDAGAEVVSVRRREPLRRPLNVPRQLFSKRGPAPFHAL